MTRLSAGLAGLDIVLGFEMTAGQVVGPGERHEGDLLALPQWIERVAQQRVQPPVTVQDDGAVGIA